MTSPAIELSQDVEERRGVWPLPNSELNNDAVEFKQAYSYLERNFVGTYLAICLGTLATYGAFIMPATSLDLINKDIGPSANITWVVLTWTLCVSVGNTLVGRLSDIFGRRWFFIIASLLATIGCVVGGTAQSVNQLIGANVLIGLAGAGQQSFNYVIGELVPVKHRFISLGPVLLFAVPFSGFGPYISRLLIAKTSQGWRWDYYLGMILKSYALLRRPLIPMHLFKNAEYCMITVIALVGGMLYYSLNGKPHELFKFSNPVMFVAPILTLSVIYPTMVGELFTTDTVYAGLLSCTIGAGVACGVLLGCLLARPGGYIRWKLIASTVSCTVFTSALASTTDKSTASAFTTLSAISIGFFEVLILALVTIVIDDQADIGAASGVLGSIRAMGGVLATAIYTSILRNKVAGNFESIVLPALAKTELPPTSIQPLLEALSLRNSAAVLAIPGVTQQIATIARTAIKKAYSNAFTVIYLCTLAFGGCAIIAAWWAPNVEDRLTDDVVHRLDANGPKSSHTTKATELKPIKLASNRKEETWA